MKSLSLFLAFVTLTCAAEDKRNVGGVMVDLTPLQTWLAASTNKGERPLKHWKQVEITKMVSGAAGLDQCVVNMEHSNAVQIQLVHTPPETKTYFNDQAQLEALTAQISQATRELDTAKATAAELNSQSRRKTHYVKPAPQAELRNLQEQQGILSKRQKANQAHAKVLAMFTGRTTVVAGVKLQVWDCGLPVR